MGCSGWRVKRAPVLCSCSTPTHPLLATQSSKHKAYCICSFQESEEAPEPEALTPCHLFAWGSLLEHSAPHPLECLSSSSLICSEVNSALGSPPPGSPPPALIPQTLPWLTLEPTFLVELKALGALPAVVDP